MFEDIIKIVYDNGDIEFIKAQDDSEDAVSESRCPNCGYKLDPTIKGFGEHTPVAGDASICFNCGDIMVFNAYMSLRKPTPQENLDIGMDVRVIEAQIFARGRPA